MRLTLWILPFALSAALLTTTSYVLADSHVSEGEQHEPLDDAALEEQYGIKAGAVKRDEEDSAEQPNGDDENNGEITADGDEAAEGGTGGTGSSDDAIENGEDEESTDDDGESEESTDDNE